MISMCQSGLPVEETGSPVELELAAAGAITIVADLVDLGLESDVGYSALTQPAVMLLATLAAKHQAHAWFAGSGRLPGRRRQPRA